MSSAETAHIARANRANSLMPCGLTQATRADIVSRCLNYIVMVNGMHWLLNIEACVNQAAGEFLSPSQHTAFSWHRAAMHDIWSGAKVAYEHRLR